MFTNDKLSKSVRLALVFGTAATAMSFTSMAQAAEEEEAKKVERIEVTGSRIKRTDMETAQPVLAITAEDIGRSGLLSVGDVLKEISTNGAALGLQTNNGNTSGESRVNLRNCASNRTLVLVNGRRWISGLGGSVDVSTIPLAAIRTIEVLKDGASSVYGTDAICGVVNVITKGDFEGAEVSLYNGETSESDGKRETYTATFGTSNDKTNVLFNISYTKQEEIMGADREISSVPIYNLPANVSINGGRASPTTPYGQFVVGGVSRTLTPGKTGCVANQACSPAAAADFKNYDGNTDGYNFAPVNYIQQPFESLSLYAQGGYAVTDTINWKTEVLYNERSSQAQLAAQPLGGLAIPANSMYNPFGAAIVGASFRPIVAPRQYNAQVNTWRFSSSLEGEFELVDRTFTWDTSATFSDNSLTALKEGFFESNRFARAIGPSFVSSTGVATCGTVAAPIAGCVPFNLFGGPEGVTQAMLDYVSVAPRDLAYSKMWNYTGNIQTELFELPAGPVAVNLGTEVRRESGYTSPEPLTVLGQVLGDNAATPTKGGFGLKEVYAELSIPLLSDMAYAQSLELSLSSRYSDYSTFGDTTNNSYKLTYRPVDELLLRASFNEGFRAPSIAELYQGQNDSRPTAADPCRTNVANSPYNTTPGVAARCAAAGLSSTFRQNDAQVRAKVGGNPALQPETSESISTGFVYSPEWVEGLGISMDWYRIEIANAISGYSAQALLNRCYVQGIDSACALITRDFTGTLNGNPGEISNIVSLNENFKGGFHVEGVDMNVDYRFVTDIGTWRANWDNAYTIYDGQLGKLERGELTLDEAIAGGNAAGRLAAGASGGGTSFRLKSNLTLSWSKDDWRASVTAQYLSKQTEECNAIVAIANGLGQPNLRNLCSKPDETRTEYSFAPGTLNIVGTPNSPYATNELKPTVYFDGQVGYTAPWEGDIVVGVRNLLDKEPPIAYSSFANSYDPNYRTPGRFFYVSYTQKF